MKVIFTAAARRNLDEILEYLLENQPSLVDPIEQRLHAVLEILGRWPESARTVAQRPNVRVASLIHYPFRTEYITA